MTLPAIKMQAAEVGDPHLLTPRRPTQAARMAECEAAVELASQQATLEADESYDTGGFIAALRERQIAPHVAQNRTNRRGAVDGRTTRPPRLHDQSAEAQAGGEDLRLGRDGRPVPANVFGASVGSGGNLFRIRNLTWITT
jgi:hypothetical protein